jgi:hypothetical protein
VPFNTPAFYKRAGLKGKQYYNDKQFRTSFQKSLQGLERQEEIKQSKVKQVTAFLNTTA